MQLQNSPKIETLGPALGELSPMSLPVGRAARPSQYILMPGNGNNCEAPDMKPEEQARQNIDALLLACGWFVQDYKAMDFTVGRGIALREVPLTTGPCDYL